MQQKLERKNTNTNQSNNLISNENDPKLIFLNEMTSKRNKRIFILQPQYLIVLQFIWMWKFI